MNKHINERKLRRKLARLAANVVPARAIAHFRRLGEYGARCAQVAAEEGKEGLYMYMAENPYFSRGHSKAKRFSSRAALTRMRPSKYMPHQGAREKARRVQQAAA